MPGNHHGGYRTLGYVFAGRLRLESGPGGGTIDDAGPGEFFVVPPHTVHRESNPGDDEQIVVGIRIGTGPTVVNVDGPEP
jgi:uncharacterized RmlC-like cupin family protein